MNDLALNRFCKIAQEALKINESIYSFWNEFTDLSVNTCSKEVIEATIVLLKEMILKRIEVVNCFELLIRLNVDEALDILESRYLGNKVCLYTKFGGVQNELGLMLSDYVEIRGENSFLNEVLQRYLSSEKLNDPRVISAFCEALDLEGEIEFKKFITGKFG